MPLSELFRLTKAKLESAEERKSSRSADVTSAHEDGVVELVWENGKISMHSQSSKSRNIPTSSSVAPHSVQSHTTKTKEVGNGSGTKMEKYGAVDDVLNEIPMSVPSAEMSLGQDDDMATWLSYPLDESLQTGYCSEFLPEVSGVTVNETDFPFSDRRNRSNQLVANSHTASGHNRPSSGQGIPLKISADETTRPRSGMSQSSSSQSIQFQTSSPYLSDSMMYSAAHRAVCEEPGQAPASASSFTDIKMQKQEHALPNTMPGLINFSYFLRPASLAKVNLQNTAVMCNSDVLSTEKMGSADNGTAASRGTPAESATVVEPRSGLRKDTNSLCQSTPVPTKVGEKELDAKVLNEPPRALGMDASSKNNQNACRNLAKSPARRGADGEKATETVVACSSVCSGNSLEGPSDDPTRDLKRKHSDIQDSEWPSEDIEEESIDAKKTASTRAGSGSKRSRSAEVHNLSERRRRDRINEKMRALQELIPNCNKVDKASMLDEAIEYLKTLQLQVQIMAMGAGYYMPPMMLPGGMHHIHAAHMAHFPPMGVGMGLGMGMGMGMGMGYGIGMPDMSGGSSGGSLVQVPPMHGTHYPGTPLSGPSGLHGRPGSRIQPFGLAGGFPVAMPHAPSLVTVPGGSLMNSPMEGNSCGVADSMKNLDSTKDSSSKDPVKNISSQLTQAHISVNPASDQQATNRDSKQSDVAQHNGEASEGYNGETVSSNCN